MRKIKIYLLRILILSVIIQGIGVTVVSGQDAHLSQYYASGLYLNPALTGKFNGDYRIQAHFRDQWMSLIDNPYITTVASFDKRLPKFNAGVIIINNRAGAGSYNALNILGSASYDHNISGHHWVSAGLQAGMMQKSLNFSGLYFDSQYNSNNLGSFDPYSSTGEDFDKNSIIMLDINVGGLYYYSDISAKINPFVGAALFHVNSPNESFFGETNKLPRRGLVHAGAKVTITPKLQLTPQVYWMKEVNDEEEVFELIAHYKLNDNQYIIFGPSYRNKDAMVIHAGLRLGSFTYRFNYDINTSDLNDFSDGKGGFEFSVTYIKSLPLKEAKVISCPRM